jgi:hypothetical protein
MATLTINFPDAIAPRVINGICKRFNYKATFEDGTPNPESKQQFARRKVIEFMKRAVREAEIETATDAAEATAAQAVETEIVLS